MGRRPWSEIEDTGLKMEGKAAGARLWERVWPRADPRACLGSEQGCHSDDSVGRRRGWAGVFTMFVEVGGVWSSSGACTL